ncbi:MAG: hypothetical protein CVU35_05665 [Betaproteobacteria bacterium HGW-Betaproteobacteria-8]|nr:MAG: hypothetical protein CVU35_05665 [Betaproteobacteria bacterium HGW-Betaproteobacteria-8]
MKRITLLVILVAAMSQFMSLGYSKEKAQRKITEVSRKVLERTDMVGSDEELRLMLVEFPPEYSNVAHSHPVAGLCYVIEGTAESQYEGEELKTIHAGDSYQDSATKKHLLFRNASKTEALRFICAAKINKETAFMQPL